MKPCPFCAEQIQDAAIKCRYCGEAVNTPLAQWQAFARNFQNLPPAEQQTALATLSLEQQAYLQSAGAVLASRPGTTIPVKSNGLAFVLGLLLGPVGLWYKRQWAAGFAWLVMGIIVGVATMGLAAPVFWIGMAIHAAVAETKP